MKAPREEEGWIIVQGYSDVNRIIDEKSADRRPAYVCSRRLLKIRLSKTVTENGLLDDVP